MDTYGNIFSRLFTHHERLKVVVFVSMASCILAISLALFVLSIGRPYIGVALSLNAQGWTVEAVGPNSQSNQAGIRKGDRPIEINGQPAETFLEKHEKAGLVFSGTLRELTVIDDEGRLKSVTLEDGSLSWQGIIEQAARLIVSLVFWIVGVYIFLKRPRNHAASVLCLFGLFFGLMLSSNMAGQIAVPTALELQVITATIGPWLLLHFFLILPEERTWLRNNPLQYAIYLPAAITLVLFPLIGLANGQPVQWFRTFRLLEVGVGLIAAGGVAIFNYFGAASIRTRQQMKIVLIACLAAIVPFLFLYLLPEAIWRQSIVPSEFNILFITFIPLGMGYAVVTRKLMDIDVVIRRGLIYGLVTVVMAAILSAGILLVVSSKESLGVPKAILLALVLGGVATTLFGPVKNVIEIMIDRLFYKDRYDYRQIIQSLSISLNLAQDLNDVSRLIVGMTVRTLYLSGGCLFTKMQSGSYEVSAAQGVFADQSNENELSVLISRQGHAAEFPNSALIVRPDLAFLIPLVVGEERIGTLCLSQKISRQVFSSNDMYLLQEIASIAAMALHRTILVRDVNIRDIFISLASHELRTPLTSIVGYADLLLRRNPADATTRKRWAKNILDKSQMVSTIIDDLLNVSRIRSGKVNIRLDMVNLSDVLNEVLSFTKETTDKHEFIVDIEPDLPDVLVDREKFGQVVGNLLSNAVKFSPNGGHIKLSTHNDKERHQAVVSITDEGIGIAPKDKDSLFTTFHRIQRPETRGIRGSGLGLYIAKEWTEAMGGKVWFESELNKGSTFFVAIPMQNSEGVVD